MPKYTSEMIRRGLPFFEAVFSYGVDGVSGGERSIKTLSSLGLTPSVFFEKLYINRPVYEGLIYSHLLAAPSNGYVVAPIGFGKSTLLHYVLRKYSETTNTPLVVIDFKAEKSPMRSQVECESHIGEMIKSSLVDDLASRTALNATPSNDTRAEAIVMLCESIIESANTASRAIKPVLDELLGLFSASPKPSPEPTLVEWMRAIRTDMQHPLAYRVAGLMGDIVKCRSVEDTCQAYARIRFPGSSMPKFAVALDNVDQVNDYKELEYLAAWMAKSYTLATSYQIIMAIRPENLYGRPIDHGSSKGNGMPSRNTGLFGEDASAVQKIEFKAPDVPEEIRKEWETVVEREFIREIDVTSYDDMTQNERDMLIFEDMIHYRRLDFIKEILGKPQANQVAVPFELEAVHAAAQEIHKIAAISIDMKEMANNNLRVKWSGVANLLEYIVCILRLEWSEIGMSSTADHDNLTPASRESRYSALRSLYYRFLGSPDELGGQPPVFHSSVFDPVGMVIQCGWDGRRLVSPSSDSVVQTCRDWLVLLAIFNACGNTRKQFWEQTSKISVVIEKCKQIGLSEGHVCAVIDKIVRDKQHRFTGMFAMSHYVPVHEKIISSSPELDISASPRLHRLLTHTSFMLGYLCERIVRNGLVVVYDHEVEYERSLAQRGLVLPKVVALLPSWLAKAMTVESRWIEMMQRSPVSQLPSKGFADYCNTFAISDSHGSRPTVFTRRIAKACVAFIDHQLAHSIDRQHESELRQTYTEVRSQLNEIDRKLDDALNRTLKGESWSIPRDMAIEI